MNIHPDIDILINMEYLENESEPERKRFLFSYTVTITNQGKHPVRLLDRYWCITDANEHIQEVHGEGVIGLQPDIEVGKSFQYTSGAMLETAVGTMEGYYGMMTADGEMFNAKIPPFTLAAPNRLH